MSKKKNHQVWEMEFKMPEIKLPVKYNKSYKTWLTQKLIHQFNDSTGRKVTKISVLSLENTTTESSPVPEGKAKFVVTEEAT